MKVYFIRHAQAQHNFDHQLYGTEAFYFPHNRFSPLTSVGIEQAIALSNSKEKPEVDIVITSSLPRTLMTTQLVYGNETTPVYVSDLVREANFHHPCNERRSTSEIRLAYPSFTLSHMISDKDTVFYSGQDDIGARCLDLIKWLEKLSREGKKSVAIITHQTFFEQFYSRHLALGTAKDDSVVTLENCGVYSTTFQKINMSNF